MKTKNLIIFHNTWEVTNNLEVEEGKMKFKKRVELSELEARDKRKTNMQTQESKQYGDWHRDKLFKHFKRPNEHLLQFTTIWLMFRLTTIKL